MTRSEQRTAARALWLLGFNPAQIVRLFHVAGLPIPDWRNFASAPTPTPESKGLHNEQADSRLQPRSRRRRP
jgi:hypothetical protein